MPQYVDRSWVGYYVSKQAADNAASWQEGKYTRQLDRQADLRIRNADMHGTDTGRMPTESHATAENGNTSSDNTGEAR